MSNYTPDPKINSDRSRYREEELDILNRFSEQLMSWSDQPEIMMTNFSRFVRCQDITRFLVMYEIFKKIKSVHGSILELGVLNGFNLFSFAHFCEIFEPRNYTRRIYGFDTFEGPVGQTMADDAEIGAPGVMDDFKTHAYSKLEDSVTLFNDAVQFNQFEKITLVPGDAAETVPRFVNEHKELIVALLICHCDIYQPTLKTLEAVWPRIPKGGVVLFGGSNYEGSPGETQALDEILMIGDCRIERFSFATKAAYIVKE